MWLWQCCGRSTAICRFVYDALERQRFPVCNFHGEPCGMSCYRTFGRISVATLVGKFEPAACYRTLRRLYHVFHLLARKPHTYPAGTVVHRCALCHRQCGSGRAACFCWVWHCESIAVLSPQTAISKLVTNASTSITPRSVIKTSCQKLKIEY